jgi:hypothetical protein
MSKNASFRGKLSIFFVNLVLLPILYFCGINSHYGIGNFGRPACMISYFSCNGLFSACHHLVTGWRHRVTSLAPYSRIDWVAGKTNNNHLVDHTLYMTIAQGRNHQYYHQPILENISLNNLKELCHKILYRRSVKKHHHLKLITHYEKCSFWKGSRASDSDPYMI